jgi:hypothetical protein
VLLPMQSRLEKLEETTALMIERGVLHGQKFRLTALHVGVSALACCALTGDTGYCFLPTGRDVPHIFEARDRCGLAVSAAAFRWVCEQVVDHPPD